MHKLQAACSTKLAALAAALSLAAGLGGATPGLAAEPAAAGARQLIEASLQRHAPPPYVYEEQTLVLSDSLGRHTVRTLRYYARHTAGGSQRLFVVDTPADSRGLSVFVGRDGALRRGAGPGSLVFGSDFTVADLDAEQPADFDYEREESQDLNRVPHHVLRARRRGAEGSGAGNGNAAAGDGERRLFVRKDNLFISRIDFLDRQGRPARRQSFRDPRPDESGAWRPGMILMEDLRAERHTLLKVERRVHAAEYVPAAVFATVPGER